MRSSAIVTAIKRSDSTCGRGLQLPQAATTTSEVTMNRARVEPGVWLQTIAHAPTTQAAADSVRSGRPPAAKMA